MISLLTILFSRVLQPPLYFLPKLSQLLSTPLGSAFLPLFPNLPTDFQPPLLYCTKKIPLLLNSDPTTFAYLTLLYTQEENKDRRFCLSIMPLPLKNSVIWNITFLLSMEESITKIFNLFCSYTYVYKPWKIKLTKTMNSDLSCHSFCLYFDATKEG